MNVDPRLNGFNYGVGWGTSPKPPIYLQAMLKAGELSVEAAAKSAEAWALEMAAREVRLASTDEEKRTAVASLHDAMRPYHNQIAAE